MLEILTSRLNDGTDIVFLIDKTGSMDDDIAEVKNSLEYIFKYLSKFSNVKVGIATYSDKNYHYDLWYDYMDLTSNIDDARKFMDSYTTISNPDIPESANDAIINTVNNMSWTPGNRRLMMIIGDAPSQQGPLTTATDDDVIRKCAAMNIKFNLYPIVIATNPYDKDPSKMDRNFVKLGPNPASSTVQLTFNTTDNYQYEINDITGKRVSSARTFGSSMSIDVSQLKNAVYLIQVSNPDFSKYFSTQLVVQH
jgi:hypothetical protein